MDTTPGGRTRMMMVRFSKVSGQDKLRIIGLILVRVRLWLRLYS